MRTVTVHSDHVRCLAYSRDGTALATASNDRTVRLLDDATTVRIWPMDGGAESSLEWGRGKVQYVAVVPDGMTAPRLRQGRRNLGPPIPDRRPAVTLFLLAFLAAPVPYKAAGLAFHPASWGVIDPAGKVAYLRHDDGVDAVEVATGKLLWRVEGRHRPLALAGGVLLTRLAEKDRQHVLRVVALDVATGKAKRELAAVELPDWVVVESPPWGRSFSASAEVEGGSLFVKYKANAWYNGGAAPSPEKEKAARKEAEGVLKMALAGGAVERLGVDKMPARAAPPALFDVEHLRGGSQKLTLRWPDTRKLPLLELATGYVTAAAALDRRSIAVVWTDKREGKLDGKLFRAEDGKEVGTFAARRGVLSLDVASGLVLVLSEEAVSSRGFRATFDRTLEAHDPRTGKAVWSRKGESRVELPLPR